MSIIGLEINDNKYMSLTMLNILQGCGIVYPISYTIKRLE